MIVKVPLNKGACLPKPGMFIKMWKNPMDTPLNLPLLGETSSWLIEKDY